ncbi:MAG: cation diffusion facilitator family transporter [Alphaproteobacteria bacterium]
MSEVSIPRGGVVAARLKARATAFSLTVALVIMGLKAATWLATGSVSVLSVLMDSVMDTFMGLLNYLAVRQAQKPPDRRFRFGYGKMEPLASLAQSMFMIGAALAIAMEALYRLFTPYRVAHADIAIGTMVVSLALTGGLVLYQRHVIRLTGSTVVRADSLHYRTDMLMYVGVIVSLLFSGIRGIGWADPVIALAIAAYLAASAKGILVESTEMLLDKELPIEDRRRIHAIALAHPSVRAIHDLRTRLSGENVFIQLHAEMDGDLPLIASHQYTDEVIDLILEAYPNAEVQVHQEPIGMPRHRSWCHKAGVVPPRFPGEYGTG